ncbi:hypothetical protein CBS101457_004089 [Exobasidium rhododendri]|nr:hypothetical protein CBS101457_004089 [Exobasidium rhododendri]
MTYLEKLPEAPTPTYLSKLRTTHRKEDSRIVSSEISHGATLQGNLTLADGMRERIRMLNSGPGIVEIASTDAISAARATAILKVFHEYVHHGVLDIEVDGEEVTMMDTSLALSRSRHHGHSVSLLSKAMQSRTWEGSPFTRASQDQTLQDKSLDEILFEMEDHLYNASQVMLQRDNMTSPVRRPTSAASAVSIASLQTPMLPGAFPTSTVKATPPSPFSRLHLSAKEVKAIIQRVNKQTTFISFNTFTKQHWQALDSLLKAEVTAMSRQYADVTKPEARLKATLELRKKELMDAFLDAYGVRQAKEREAGEWTDRKVHFRIVALIQSLLRFLKVRYPELNVDAEITDTTVMGKIGQNAEKAEVDDDESGVAAEATLRLPFELMLESTPAPRLQMPAPLRQEESSPSFHKGRSSSSRSTSGINIYPRLPSPVLERSVKGRVPQSESRMAFTSASREADVGGKRVIKREGGDSTVDKSSSLIEIASKSLSFVRATFGLQKDAMPASQSSSSSSSSSNSAPVPTLSKLCPPASHHLKPLARNNRHLSLSNTSRLDSSRFDQSTSASMSVDRSQSRSAYQAGSARLLRGGTSSSVAPTSLSCLRMEDHIEAKSKAQQLRQSREARKWKSPQSSRFITNDASGSINLSQVYSLK